ncbi:hypothetical protein IW261DRAFT_1424683 [Armillaria novae-zelandiae]|uniref:Uncharacterized protein n=1 Tax=Armillaria novae-zelandiae TaxID=153914 RepID=A0AA39NUF6_9AGAR|nr:hypothetical protein IW261DRAFT_1424683 [Armillaria novae-zelandiae]
MVARLRTAIQFVTILLSLHAAALPASRIYRRDDDPSSTLPDPDENQDIQSVRDYMQKSIQAYLATQNTQKGAIFMAETSWRAIVVDTTGIGDDSDSDSAGTDVMTGGDSSSAGEDVMTGDVDRRGAEREGLTEQASKRDVNEDEEVYDGEEWWKRYSGDDDELLGSALVDREGEEFEDVGSEDTSSGDTESDDTSSDNTDSEDTSSGDTESDDTSSGDTDSEDSSSGSSSSGDSSSSSNDDTEVALANNDVYQLFDKVSPSKSDHINFFSDQYIQFTKEIGDIFSGEQASKEESQKLQKLAQLQSTLCTVELTDVTDKAYYYYEQTKKYNDKAGGRSSQDFKTWAATEYTEYMMTYDQCRLALVKYNTLADDIFGKFRGPINAASNKIAPLDSGQVNVPGVTMMLGSGTGSLTGQGNAVPYYSLPGARGTVAAWRKQAQEESGGMRRRKTGSGDEKTDAGDGKGDGKGDEKTGKGNGNTDNGGGASGGVPGGFSSGDSGGDANGDKEDTSGDDAGDDTASEGTDDSGDSSSSSGGEATFKVPRGFFSYSSSSKSGSVEGETDNGGGSVGLDFKFFSVGAGADTTTSSTSTELKMKSFSIAWQAALLPVQRGTWFDGFRVASLMSNLGTTGTSADDDENDRALYANATHSFNKWFGTDDRPGPAADYNDIALIIYHPIFKMEFSDAKTYQEFKETKASAGVCFLFICVGGNGGSSSNKTSFSETSSAVTYEDLSNNVYYAGSLQGSFWTQSSNDSDSDSSSEVQVEKRRLLDWRSY